MEFFVEKDELNRVLGIASRFVPTKTTMQVMECFLFTVTDEVMITANDTEIGVNAFVNDAEVKEEGKIAINAKTLTPIISKLPNGKVHFQTENETVKITCGKAKFSLATLNGDNFPDTVNVEGKNNFVIDQEELSNLISQTIFSTSQNSNNRIMTGEYLELSDKLKITALDGHRVAIRTADIQGDFKAIIPNRTLAEIMKMPHDGDVNVYLNDTHIVFKYPDTTVISRLIDGEPFDTDRIMTTDFNTEVTVDRKEFQSALERSLILNPAGDNKPVVLNVGDDLNISMQTTLGSMSESISAEKKGEDLRIGLNAKFVIDALKAITEDTVTLSFNNEKTPVFINGEDYKYIVLPVKLAG